MTLHALNAQLNVINTKAFKFKSLWCRPIDIVRFEMRKLQQMMQDYELLIEMQVGIKWPTDTT